MKQFELMTHKRLCAVTKQHLVINDKAIQQTPVSISVDISVVSDK